MTKVIMMVELVSQDGNSVTIQVTIGLTGTMLDIEKQIQHGVNDVGSLATRVALKSFDTDGSAIKVGSVKFTAKKLSLKNYETPYGCVPLERYVYQTSKGGELYCPLDDRARIIVSSTPSFAKMVSYKYGQLGASDVVEDLKNHGRSVTQLFVQDIGGMVGAITQATEESWEYSVPEQEKTVSSISVSLDGTCMLMKSEDAGNQKGVKHVLSYREAMTGNLSLYDDAGNRLHTIYLGAAPEYGKESFLKRLKHEIDRIKTAYPAAHMVGIADGASCNWGFLTPLTDTQILDFYHATEYLADASLAFATTAREQRAWLEDACHKLKYDDQAAQELLDAMKKQQVTIQHKKKIAESSREKLDKAITYFTNQLSRMNYKDYQEKKFPIGSGVTEAACKTLIKERLCRSGMRWKTKGASIVISLRALTKTTGRWEQFWAHINSQGLGGIHFS